MAGSTEFEVKLKAKTDEVIKALGSLKKEVKGLEELQAKYRKEESKATKEKSKATKEQTSRVAAATKKQRDMQKEIATLKSRERKEEIRHLKKIERQNERMHKKMTRLRKKEQRQIEGYRRRIGRGLRSGGRRAAGAGVGLAGAALGFLFQGAQASYGKYLEAEKAKSGAVGLRARGQEVQTALNRAKGPGVDLGYNVAEVAKMAPMMARSTGVSDPTQLMRANRAYGFAPGQSAGYFSTIREAGYDFKPGKEGASAGGRQFVRMMSMGVQSGIERARLPEYMEGIQKVTEAMGQRTVGAVNLTGIAEQLSMWGKVSDQPGMQGRRGAQLFQKLDQAFMKPGGGEWGQGLMLRAMGFGRGKSFYQAEKMREQGLGNPENAMRLVSQVVKEHGAGPEGALAMRAAVPGTTLAQAEELIKIYTSNEDRNAKLKKIRETAQKSKSLEQQSVDAMEGIGGTLEHLAGLFNESVGHGATVAEEMQALERFQRDIFSKLLEVAKETKKYIKIIADLISEFVGESGAAGEAKAARGKFSSYLTKELEENTWEAAQRKAKNMEAQQQRLAKAAEKGTNASTFAKFWGDYGVEDMNRARVMSTHQSQVVRVYKETLKRLKKAFPKTKQPTEEMLNIASHASHKTLGGDMDDPQASYQLGKDYATKRINALKRRRKKEQEKESKMQRPDWGDNYAPGAVKPNPSTDGNVEPPQDKRVPSPKRPNNTPERRGPEPNR